MTTSALTSRTPSRLETALVRGAAAVITVHVLDDNFVQPNPGTSAADHLAGGLVPAALLLLAAALHPRMRPAARAAVAVLIGLFGIAAGLEAVHYTREVGPSGDDFTGLLCIPAGAMLLPLAGVVLWRERRRDGSLARRWGRRGLLGVGAAAVVFVLVGPVLFSYGFTHLGRAAVPEPRLGAAHEEVSFRTSDGLRLRGWYVPSRNGAAVIAFPGRKGPQSRARFLARHGYGVLLFDRRGEGESDGDPNAFGWDGDRDVKAAIRFLRSRPDVDGDRIGGLGLSVGGELMLETAAETPALRAVVSEGAGHRSYRESRDLGGAGWLSLVPTAAAVTAFSGHTPPPALSDLVRRIQQPALLIHGRHSQQGTERRYNELYDRAGGPNVTRWEIADSGHVGGMDAAPEEYERRVIAFLDRALRPG
jgi:fermentation-respiration switch protein FrsA (DUF1100 family)